MAAINTIIIECDAYKKRNKYYWKNENGMLSDLSENTNSPFSRSKPRYKKFSKAAMKDIADELVQVIGEVYSGSNGLCIEVNGTEEDFGFVKEVIEKNFSDKGMECKFGSKRLRSAEEVLPEIKEIYRDLTEIILQYSDEEKKTLFWNLVDMSSILKKSEENLTPYDMCRQASDNLGEILEVIREKADKFSNMAYEQEKAYEAAHEKRQEKERVNDSAKVKDDKLSVVNPWLEFTLLKVDILKTCEEEKKAIDKEFVTFEKMIKQEYFDEKRIENCIEAASTYVTYAEEGKGDDDRINYVKKKTAQYAYEDILRIREDIKDYCKKGIETLKKKLLGAVQIYNGTFVELTEQQKQRLIQCIKTYENMDVFYNTSTLNDEIIFKCRDVKGGSICREYRRKLEDVWRDEKKFLTRESKAALEKWSKGLLDKLEEIFSLPEAAAEQESDEKQKNMEKQKSDEEQKKLFCDKEVENVRNHQEKVQKGKEEIERMISFKEVPSHE